MRFFLPMFLVVATSFKQKEAQQKDKAIPVTLPRAAATLALTGAASDPLASRVGRLGQVAILTWHDHGVNATWQSWADVKGDLVARAS